MDEGKIWIIAGWMTIMAVWAGAQPGPPQVLGYGDRWLYGDLHLERVFGQVDDATISGAGAYFSQNNLGWILPYLAGRAHDGDVVSVTDEVKIGAVEYRYALADAAGKTFLPGMPVVRLGIGSELTPYVIILPGEVVGSARGFLIEFDGAMQENETLRIFFALKSVPQPWVTYADLAVVRRKGMILANEAGLSKIVRKGIGR